MYISSESASSGDLGTHVWWPHHCYWASWYNGHPMHPPQTMHPHAPTLARASIHPSASSDVHARRDKCTRGCARMPNGTRGAHRGGRAPREAPMLTPRGGDTCNFVTYVVINIKMTSLPSFSMFFHETPPRRGYFEGSKQTYTWALECRSHEIASSQHISMVWQVRTLLTTKYVYTHPNTFIPSLEPLQSDHARARTTHRVGPAQGHKHPSPLGASHVPNSKSNATIVFSILKLVGKDPGNGTT
jgi:hypothetical protein